MHDNKSDIDVLFVNYILKHAHMYFGIVNLHTVERNL